MCSPMCAVVYVTVFKCSWYRVGLKDITALCCWVRVRSGLPGDPTLPLLWAHSCSAYSQLWPAPVFLPHYCCFFVLFLLRMYWAPSCKPQGCFCRFLGSLVVFFHHRWAARMIPNAVPSPALGHPRAEEIGAAEPAGGQPGARGTNLPGFGIHGAVAGGVIGCGSNHWVSFGLQGLWLPMMAPSSFR